MWSQSVTQWTKFQIIGTGSGWGSYLRVCRAFFCFCFNIYLSIYIFLVVLSFLCYTRAFLQFQRLGATFELWCTGFLLWWLLLFQSMGSRCVELQ